MQIYSKTDVGKVRSTNQDAFIAGEIDGAVFAVVCDGMGGANAGNIASQTAVKIVSEYIIRSYRQDLDSIDIENLLRNAILSANMEVYDLAMKDNSLKGMGTTVVATVIKNGTAVIAHVGDSRAYTAKGELIQLTRDHSVVQSLIESGKISAEDAKVHPKKNVITRALGVEENVICDVTTEHLAENQILLLCTDGLTGYVDTNMIFETIKTLPVCNVPERLVNLALNGGGGDNITVVIIVNQKGI